MKGASKWKRRAINQIPADVWGYKSPEIAITLTDGTDQLTTDPLGI